MKTIINAQKIVFSALLLLLAAGGSSWGREHELQKDETLYSVARQYGVDISDLLELNGIQDARRVRAGTLLTIPEETSAQPGSAAVTYRVQRGDTYYSIARKNGMSVEELLALNRRSTSDLLRVDEQIVVGKTGVAVAQDTNPANTSTGETPPVIPAASRNGERVEPPRYPVAGFLMETDDAMGSVVIHSPEGGDVYSLSSGTVVWLGPFKGYGKVVLLEDPLGRIHIYGGIDTFQRFSGENVARGDVIGRAATNSVLRYAIFSGQEPLAVSLSRFSRLGEDTHEK